MSSSRGQLRRLRQMHSSDRCYDRLLPARPYRWPDEQPNDSA